MGKPVDVPGMAVIKKQEADALRVSETRLREVLENSLDASYKRNLQTNAYEYLSPTFARISGYTRDEMDTFPLETILNFMHPDDRAETKRVIAEAIADSAHGPCQLVYRFKHKDGQYRWFHDQFTVMRDSAGQAAALIGSVSDISERKKAEDGMRKSEAKYRLLADNASDVIWTADMDLNTTYISPSIYAMQGHTPEEAMNLTEEQRYTPESLEMVSRRFIEAVANEAAGIRQPDDIGTYEAEYIRKDGSTYWTETKASIIRDTDGKAEGILGVTRDISQRRAVQMALWESEERFRRVSQVSTDIAYSCLTDKEGAWQIDWISGAIEQTTGFTADEIKEQSCWRFLVAEEDIPLFEKNVVGLSPGQSVSCDLRICHKHGQIVWVRSFAECISEINTSKGIRLYGGLRDINERKQAEKILRESEERYRNLFNNAQVGLFRSRLSDGRVIACNERFAKGLGYSTPEECCAIYVASEHYVDPEERSRMIAELLKEGQVANFDLQITREDGTRAWTSLSARVYPEEGLLEGAVVDITERKQAEAALKVSEAQYRLLAEHTADIVALMDMDLIVTYQSPSSEKVRGFTSQELRDLPLEKNLAPESLKLGFEALYRELPGIEADPGYNPVIVLDLEYYRKDGTTVWFESKFSIIRDVSGKPVSLLLEARDISDRRQAEEKLLKSYESVKKTLDDAINTMVKIVELRDPYTAGHQQKVADLATAIAREMKLEDTRIEQLRTAAMIHDIGKMYVPSDILSKPGKLSAIELGLIKTHSKSGYDIVKGMDFPATIALAVLQHHERLDGSGYPDGIKGKDMLLEAKILVVADVVEAMASHRPYRPAMGIDKALEELSNGRGKLYDPDVVDTCLELFNSGKFEFKTA